VNQPGDKVTVFKMDTQGGEKWRWLATVLRVDARSIQVEGHFNAPEVERFGLAFCHGDRLVETYFVDRWYNLFAIYGADAGEFKGWYCNIARPPSLRGNELIWVDLELDVVVLPDRRAAVLDEEEFAALVIPEDERVAARRAVDELLHHARAASGPFASAGSGDPTPT
jgi:protein associated with RNAse G/E